MQISMLDDPQKWIFNFIMMHERLDKYNAIWLSVPTYHDLIQKNKSYKDVSQWNGQEIKQMRRYLLAVVTQSLRDGNYAQHNILNRAFECTLAFLEFYMYGRYKSHDEATFSYVEDAFQCLHTFKVVFWLGQVGKNANPKANALRTELVKN
jgi:hypothetical protein